MSDEKPAHEIVIIRRRGGNEDEAHHGGVWKIAYADFMTAMMAFFLVMWLINASNKKTITEIASYFNPIKLSNRVTNPKGVHDMPEQGQELKDVPADGEDVGGGHGQSNKAKKAESTDHKVADGKDPEPALLEREDGVFRDPYGLLAKLAAQADVEAQAADSKSGAMAAGQQSSGGEAFRDPFDPALQPAARMMDPALRPAEDDQANLQKPEAGEIEADLQTEKPESPDTASPPAVGPSPEVEAATEAAEFILDKQGMAEAKKIATEIAEKVGATPGKVPNIEVEATSEGVLISLTDEFDFGMFATASAQPRPELVVVMEKIAGILRARAGRIVVRGHTDGRPFKNPNYDNWRLSTARAHMAYHMLVRGGLEEKRVERVEGHADRSLKIPANPGAAPNRRIEILLRVGET